MRETLEFLKAAIRRPMEVSTVFPTSRYLSEAMLKRVNFKDAKSIAELGPGTGAITRHLQKKLQTPESYLGIEINAPMVDFLRREFTQLRFELGVAENLSQMVDAGSVDAVVSSLPWTLFPDQMQESTLKSIHVALRPGGVFVTYICVNATIYPQAKGFLRRMQETFSDVSRSALEWRNLPPAYVYLATK